LRLVCVVLRRRGGLDDMTEPPHPPALPPERPAQSSGCLLNIDGDCPWLVPVLVSVSVLILVILVVCLVVCLYCSCTMRAALRELKKERDAAVAAAARGEPFSPGEVGAQVHPASESNTAPSDIEFQELQPFDDDADPHTQDADDDGDSGAGIGLSLEAATVHGHAAVPTDQSSSYGSDGMADLSTLTPTLSWSTNWSEPVSEPSSSDVSVATAPPPAWRLTPATTPAGESSGDEGHRRRRSSSRRRLTPRPALVLPSSLSVLQAEHKAAKARLRDFEQDFEARYGRKPRKKSEWRPVYAVYERYEACRHALRAHESQHDESQLESQQERGATLQAQA